MPNSHEVDFASGEEVQRLDTAEDWPHRLRAAAPDLAIIGGFVLFALLLIGAAMR